MLIIACAAGTFFFCRKTAENKTTKTQTKTEQNKTSSIIEKSISSKFFCEDIDEKKLMPTSRIEQEDFLPQNAKPFAGIVSHHLLAHTQIEKWFQTLAAQRADISTFIVLSPSHWGLSTGDYSMTFGSWLIKENETQSLLQTDTETARQIFDRLNAAIDDTVFEYEHGVSALAPYIKKYFPQSKIVAIAYPGEPPVDQNFAQKLYEAIKPCFDFENDKNNGNFLLISSDFSHHQNLQITQQRDCKSRAFLENPTEQSWILAICDNRPAMYALKKLLPQNAKSTVLFNTNSFELSNEGEDDVTSYFFCFFY